MKVERPLQEQELKILDDRLIQDRALSKRGVRGLIAYVVFVLTVIVHYRVTRDTTDIIFTAPVFIIFAAVAIVTSVKDKKKRKSIAHLRDKNLVTVVVVNSAICYVLKENKKEGVHYLYQLDNNKILSFGGPDFYEDDDFPNDNFEIVEGRGIKNEVVLFETIVYGRKIEPKKVISGQEKLALLSSPHYPDPNKLTIVDGKIEDYIPLLLLFCIAALHTGFF